MFQNGVKYCIDGAAFVQYGYDARVEVVGTKGVIHIGRNEKNFIQCITPEHGQQKEFITSWTKLFKDAYLEEEMHFVDCIINDKEPKVTGFDGLMAVKIVELGNKSISTGQIVEV